MTITIIITMTITIIITMVIIMVIILIILIILIMSTCTVAGRMLRAAAQERRGEMARRAMADMICCKC